MVPSTTGCAVFRSMSSCPPLCFHLFFPGRKATSENQADWARMEVQGVYLPAELLFHIMKYAGSAELCTISVVCSCLYDLACSNALWKEILRKRFGDSCCQTLCKRASSNKRTEAISTLYSNNSRFSHPSNLLKSITRRTQTRPNRLLLEEPIRSAEKNRTELEKRNLSIYAISEYSPHLLYHFS